MPSQCFALPWADDDGVKNVRAQATVSLSDGTFQLIKSAGLVFNNQNIDDPTRQIIETQLADLRVKLYAVGFSKEEVETAEEVSICDSDYV